MRAAELLAASCESDRYESAVLVYPILYNYRHAVELALKWIIMKFGHFASVEVRRLRASQPVETMVRVQGDCS